LYGYHPIPSESVHDDLTISAAAFRYGEEEIILLSATVCSFAPDLADSIRAFIGKGSGLSPSRIILAAIHTHSGPAADRYDNRGDYDRDYCDQILSPACLKAARKAVDSRRPVRLGIGEGVSDVGINRRELMRDGRVEFGQNPWGANDPRMTVLSFTDLGGKALFNIIHYSAHCTAAGINSVITRDWAGVMIDRLEAESGALTFFCNGTIGDTGPRLSNGKTVGDISAMEELGGRAGLDAVRIWRSIKEYREIDFALAEGIIAIPRMPLLPLEQVRELLPRCEELSTAGMETRIHGTLKEIEALHKAGKTEAGDFTHSQTIFRLGPVVIVPWPF
jgi:hypothetical protein